MTLPKLTLAILRDFFQASRGFETKKCSPISIYQYLIRVAAQIFCPELGESPTLVSPAGGYPRISLHFTHSLFLGSDLRSRGVQLILCPGFLSNQRSAQLVPL